MFIDEMIDYARSGATPRLRLFDELPYAQVYQIDEVARYANAQAEAKGIFDWGHEIPVVAPLAPVVWMEWDARAAAGEHLGYSERCKTVGVLSVYMDARGLDLDEDEQDARWLLVMMPLYGDYDGKIRWNRLLMATYVTKDGRPLEFRAIPAERTFSLADDPLTADEMQSTGFSCAPALMAMVFAQCKGVQTSEHQQPRQQRRARERSGQPPLLSYRTIDIYPAIRVLREEGGVEQTGLRKALHVCRGHFKHWAPGTFMGRKDAPAMTLLVPMHVRGKDKERVALHDYRVHAPKEP